MLADIPSKAGLTGAHLLMTDTPRTSGLTTEQQIRGSDGVADWIVLISGYEPAVVADVVSTQFSAASLRGMSAKENPAIGQYRLAYAMTSQDVTA